MTAGFGDTPADNSELPGWWIKYAAAPTPPSQGLPSEKFLATELERVRNFDVLDPRGDVRDASCGDRKTLVASPDKPSSCSSDGFDLVTSLSGSHWGDGGLWCLDNGGITDENE